MKHIESLRIILVRHGETEGNANNMLQGQTDFPLTPKGEDQARKLGEVLPPKIDYVYSSPLIRAYETASIAIKGNQSVILTDDRLMEMNLGTLEGRSRSELTLDEQIMWHDLRIEPDFKAHGGESAMEMVARLQTFLNDLLKNHEDNEVLLLVTHYGVIKMMTEHIMKLNLPGSIDNGAFHIVDYSQDKWRVFMS